MARLTDLTPARHVDKFYGIISLSFRSRRDAFGKKVEQLRILSPAAIRMRSFYTMRIHFTIFNYSPAWRD
jgi:hypothetical protein